MELGTTLALTGLVRTPGPASAAPPTAAGPLADLLLDEGVVMTPVDLSLDFAGAGLVFSLAPSSDPLPEGLSLSSDGLLSGTPVGATAAPLGIVVRATNVSGSAESAFQLTVEAMLLGFSATLTGLTDTPAHGASAQDGVALTAQAQGFTGALPAAISYQWATLESGAIAGATGASFTPDASVHDGETLFCTISAPPYPNETTPTAIVRHPPPVAVGQFDDEILDLGSGAYAIDAAAVFAGEGVAFSVTGPGCSIDPATGLLTITTDSAVAGAIVAVVATNSGGEASAAFQLTVEDLDAGIGPELSSPLLDEATDSISFTVSEDCTIYWRRDPVGANPDAGQVIAGGGVDSGSFPVTAGTNSTDIAFAPGSDGVQSLSLVAAVIPSEPSLVRTVTIDIDTAAPQFVSSAPATGEVSVAADIAPRLTFDEPLAAGQGTVTLWDVASANAAAVWDIVADAGTGPGQIEIAAERLTLRPPSNLVPGRQYAVLMEEGALRDIAGNPHPGMSDPGLLVFTVTSAALVETGFGAAFPDAFTALWDSMQANAFNAAVVHRPAEAWSAYSPGPPAGGVVGQKSGPYAQLRFAVPVTAGRTYEIDADLPIGESQDGAGFAGILRVKIGSAINLSDYELADFSAAGQPRVEALRGITVEATTPELWFAVISETNVSGAPGGDPAIAMLRVREV